MKSTRILVVDDDDHVREALVEELSPTYAVDAVGSSTEALDLLAMDRYDVVISDLKMPDHDGIEVLEFARVHQGDAVRVLLTGYLDEHASRALMSPDAPFKVGKPWHDEIEIVVRRGLEQREIARRLSASVDDALRLATIDTELETATTLLELTDVLVRRALSVDGVVASCVVTTARGTDHVLSGSFVPTSGPGWYLDLPIDGDGELRLRARGIGEGSQHLISYMAHRAQRRFGVLEPAVMALHSVDDRGTRVHQLVRQATLGALTSSLLHDLASTLQTLSGALSEISLLADGDARFAGPVNDATVAGDTALQLFINMRKFIRGGEVQTRPIPVFRLVDSAVRIAGGYVRERATLDVHPMPDASILGGESLLLQVLSNLLRNAANASPPGGKVDVEATATADEVVITVTDDGPGVAPAIADSMFEPFATTTQDGTGLGLAIAAYVIQLHKGRISYRKHPTRGACFQVRLHRCEPVI